MIQTIIDGIYSLLYEISKIRRGRKRAFENFRDFYRLGEHGNFRNDSDPFHAMTKFLVEKTLPEKLNVRAF